MSESGGTTPEPGEDVPGGAVPQDGAPEGVSDAGPDDVSDAAPDPVSRAALGPASDPVSDDVASDGSVFGGRYLLGDLLGVGGTASVFAAEDLGETVGDGPHEDSGDASKGRAEYGGASEGRAESGDASEGRADSGGESESHAESGEVPDGPAEHGEAPDGSVEPGEVEQPAESAHPVALKILHPHLSADAASRDAFLAEARAAQELRHPNIASVRASGVQEAAGVVLAWIALDLVDGGSVGERVDASGPLPPAEAAAVLDGVLAALTVAHRVRLVHRDVSPANVLLHGVGPDEPLHAEHVRLVDFGLADAAGRTAVGRDVLRAGAEVLRTGPGPDGSAVTVVLGAAEGGTVGRTVTAGSAGGGAVGQTVTAGSAGGARNGAGNRAGTGAGTGHTGAARTVVGNPQFMSPEQAQGRPVRVAGDLYQAGALLYYLLTGSPPYPRDTDAQVLDAHVTAPPPVPSALVPRARPFDRIVTRAMNKTPVRRFRDAEEMRAAIIEAAARLGPTAGRLSARGASVGGALAGGVSVGGALAGGEAQAGDGGTGGATGAGAGSGTSVGQRRTGDLEYLAPAEPESLPDPPRRSGVIGVVVIGLFVAGLAAWAAVAAPGLPQAGTTPSPSASVSASPAPTASPTADPSPSSTASTEPSPTASPSQTAPTSSPSPSPSATPTTTEAPPRAERIRVPLLTGTLAEAQAALGEVGLVMGEVTHRDSPEPAGTVLGQRPVGGRSVLSGTEVDVVVASGRNAVPRVAGMTVGAAVAELESAGFEVVMEDPNAPPTIPASGTTPSAGTVLRLGVSVTLLVGEPNPEPSSSPT